MLSCLLLFRIELIRGETTASKNRDKNEDWKGGIHGMHIYLVYVRSLFKTIDT